MTIGTRISAGIGAAPARLAAVAGAAGLLAAVAAIAGGIAAPAAAALVASWLFFAGLAAGSVALAAAVRIAHGGWARPIVPLAEAGAGYFLPAAVLLAPVIAARAALAPGGPVAPAAVRLVLSAALVFALGARFVAAARAPRAEEGKVRGAALVYVLGYVVGLSVWAHDLVMAFSEGPVFTVVPAYYFMGAFLSGLAWVALNAAVRDVSGPDLRHDVGKLLFGFIVVWSYLLWALFLPTWYGNIPEEAAVLLRRWEGVAKPVTIAVLVAVFAWPFWLLFSERMKRRRATLAVGAATILLGLWGERFLLVVPSLHLHVGGIAVVLAALVALGVAGTFVLAMGARLGREGETSAGGAG